MECSGQNVGKKQNSRNKKERVFGEFLGEETRCGDADHEGHGECEDGPREGPWGEAIGVLLPGNPVVS